MLILKNIIKDYQTGATKVEALRGVDLQFRDSEFAAILGPSGCGKTTLLNIIGGLDQYTSGDLSVNGRSTRQFKDKDWDTYRNHSIGFVFQNYNLIPHQTVLSNVELALTLSGVSRGERRKRALDALARVGLSDQVKKKPNQMSGGQMQRVAIARALVNDPDILLADEPTGALDSETSVQVMDILKEIAKDKLVIMVTHNPDLADTYANRIIKLLDGKVVSDSNPCKDAELKAAAPAPRQKKPSMSFKTALSLSLNNLMTKKGRTLLTSFAGSIGIIGIALILSLSAGVNAYIERVEADTLSSYPLMIEGQTMDMSGMLTAIMGSMEESASHKDGDMVYSGDVMTKMMSAMMSEVSENNLTAFKAYLEKEEIGIDHLVSGIQYEYATPLTLYRIGEDGRPIQVNPSTTMEKAGILSMMDTSAMAGSNNLMMSSTMSQLNAFEALLDNEDLLNSQFEVVTGRMPEQYDEVVLIVNRNNEISDFNLYTLGLKDQDEIAEQMDRLMMGEELISESISFTYEEMLDLRFYLMLNTDYYEKQDEVWADQRGNEEYILKQLEDALEIKVVGIIRPREDAVATSITGGVGYRNDLMAYLIDQVNHSDIVKAQQQSPDIDIFTGMPFASEESVPAEITMDMIPEQYRAFVANLTPEQLQAMAAQYAPPSSDATLEENLLRLGVSSIDSPSSIYIYPKDFEAKEEITRIIEEYNASVEEADAIRYTDYVGLMMNSVTTIINAITYILIAFVAISLVVSSIMIGIITYISVLERTKEIGILRAIGASKKDISRVFNAETLIVGFTAGAIGIGVTLALVVLINIVIKAVTSISNLAGLPLEGAVILVAISMTLTFIAGLIPSRMAAKKDPVEALRSE